MFTTIWFDRKMFFLLFLSLLISAIKKSVGMLSLKLPTSRATQK